MFTYKGFVVSKNLAGWWCVKDSNGTVCVITRGTQREVRQTIEAFLREKNHEAV